MRFGQPSGMFKCLTKWTTTLAVVFACTACSKPAFDRASTETHAYTLPRGSDPLTLRAPTFAVEKIADPVNRIGEPKARYDESGKEDIYVSPDSSAVYTGTSHFTTASDSYTNLIYRVHFEKVPFHFWPFHVTAGKNVGIIIVVTLNSKQQPVLITTVHTCGCYKGIIPTSYLPTSAYPDGWNTEVQDVYGENLPGLLDYKPFSDGNPRLMVAVRDEVHRIRDVWLEDASQLATTYAGRETVMQLRTLRDLLRLTLPDGVGTSFYHGEGPRKGYVKGARKPFERLIFGWWVFDSQVGVDREYDPHNLVDSRFYTSLKPWAAKESDMANFPRFLSYWGWKL